MAVFVGDGLVRTSPQKDSATSMALEGALVELLHIMWRGAKSLPSMALMFAPLCSSDAIFPRLLMLGAQHEEGLNLGKSLPKSTQN